MSIIIDEYIDFIKSELEKLEQGKFTGNVEFQVNFKDGGIANMNSVLRKSIRLGYANRIE